MLVIGECLGDINLPLAGRCPAGQQGRAEERGLRDYAFAGRVIADKRFAKP